MKTKDIERVIVTGEVGFIDSHLIDNIITQDTHVTVFDNITNGTLQNIKQRIDKPNLTFIKGDLPNPPDIKKLQEKHHDLIFHLAANPEVRVGSTSPDIHYKQNVSATYNLLETARKAGNEQLKKLKSTHTNKNSYSSYMQPNCIVRRQLCRNQINLNNIRSSDIRNNPAETAIPNHGSPNRTALPLPQHGHPSSRRQPTVKPSTTTSSTTLNAQTHANAMLKSLTTSSMLKASADGSIVITLAPGLTIIFYSHKASEARLIVWTIAEFFVWTKESDSKRLGSRNYYRVANCD